MAKHLIITFFVRDSYIALELSLTKTPTATGDTTKITDKDKVNDT